ncbi:F0F1 ATP synthase subunit B [Aquihabitans sp. McL0605]|uniref:F0F1 ATP synthase subunit B n=1 Tax=Aquihabitans sp. McL0605 TaxID=3415671 RepID=UPI003CE85C27
MQRIRLLLVAAAIVLVSTVGLTHPASAQESANYKDHSTEECAKLLAEGQTIDDCQKAPNPLVPEANELIWGFIGFALVFAFLTWKALPAMKSGMNARTERIKGDLDSAEAQRTEATEILAQYQAQLADARSESARIIEEARQAADEVRSTLQAKAEADISELKTKATTDIESAKVQAIADLRGEVAALAIGAAEQVVGRNLDQETNTALVEAYINQVGANS